MLTTHHAHKVPHAHVLTLLPPSLSPSSYMNLGHPLGHAGDGMHTKLTNEMRHLRRESGVTVLKSIAPVIVNGRDTGTAVYQKILVENGKLKPHEKNRIE